MLHTLLVKYFNDLLEKHCSERNKDEVSYLYVGDVFCIHLGTKYVDFQEKNLHGDFWEKVPNFVYYIKMILYIKFSSFMYVLGSRF